MSQELVTTLLPLALIGLIALVVGAVAGFLLAGLSNTPAQPEPKHSKSQAELARLWRDRRSGNVSIEMDGKMLKSASELTAAQRDALTQAMDELQLWLTAGELVDRALGVQPVPAPVAPLPEPSPLAPPAPKPVSPAPAGVAAAGAALPEVLLPHEAEVKPPSMELRDILSRAFTPNDKAKAAPKTTKSIAAQVDEIIKEKLPSSPFKNHLITMVELPGAGLLVKVDDARYEGVGDVPDPEIRLFLRQCVTEWERRTENAK